MGDTLRPGLVVLGIERLFGLLFWIFVGLCLYVARMITGLALAQLGIGVTR